MAKKKKARKKKKQNTVNAALELKIIKVFKSTAPGKPYTWKKIIKKFIRKHQKPEIVDAINSLLDKGELDQIDNNNLVWTAGRKAVKTAGKATRISKNTYEGKVDLTSRGDAYIVCKELSSDVFVSSNKLMFASDGDIVNISVSKKRGRRGKLEGEVVEIVRRLRNQFIGTIDMMDDFAFLVTDHFVPYDIFISANKLNGAKQDDKAIVKVLEWPSEKAKSPKGEVIDIVTGADRNEVEMKSILMENGFSLEFPDEVMEEAEAINETISKEEIEKRRDLRKTLTLTIDPDDAKDFDDALSFEVLENGNYEIGVHIADVSHYVQPKSPLDIEAQERATSVYLVDRVLPMLPEKISNKVCSLRPNEEKLTFSAIFTMNDKADVLDVWYGKTVIESDKRFTYDAAQLVIEGAESPFSEPISTLNKLAKLLRKKRFDEGSIGFESTEVKFKLDEHSKPIGLFVKEMKDSNYLIEDFMLLANRYVAKYLAKLHIGANPLPSVYRVHDTPDMAKLEILSNFAKNFGYNIKFTDPQQTSGTLNDLFTRIKGRNEKGLLEQLAIRSMAKAVYTTDNIGHYGLAFEFYTHFTSPIRRYPDVLTHRILQEYLITKKELYHKAILEDMCAHASNMERSAMKSERESVKYKQVEYMSERIGEEFDGIITGVIARGIFVELIETKCEGLVSISDLGYYDLVFDEAKVALIDTIHDIKFQLGNEVRVSVVETNLSRRTIDLALVDEMD